ncbi:uncharacterized protein BDR25DRAFT_305714 [Lindgomyces ingoldianus]|uniref:Uncharacterized protein n=1 Tax=Lindgomyces ingoldianus TaxID=673940 RepID=A0ACB6QKB2_9PLEO|nr:uncharacterized protein BDR25DRAFT_305714 [Lindgomyces ingoldianus]KAF2467321.1 hypothetical protein BDR25DRAFT_305714 [Lindgomyces ingoldianus]
MDEDDDFAFSDCDLDDLPANTLQQLETAAIELTQHPPNPHRAADSDYGLEDGDEVINLDDDAAPPPPLPQLPQLPRPSSPRAHDHNGSSHDAIEAEEQPRRSQVDVGQLLRRIKKLEQDKARLNRDLQGEKSKALSRSGEVDTVRRRFEAATRENERRLLALQQSHSHDFAKQKAELEKMRRERETAQTNNLFLEHDLAREADRARRVKKGAKEAAVAGPKANASPVGTPKRPKALPFRDGFDDEDIVMASPTKNRDRPKPPTPRQVGKRKRQITDQSPIPALQLSEPRGGPKAQEPSVQTHAKLDAAMLEKLRRDDHRFDLLHRLVNHRSSNGTDRVLEALTQYALPSRPDKRLSSILYDDLSHCSVGHDVRQLALRICYIFLSLWDRCLREKYYAPVYLFLDALQFILACEPASTAVALTERAIPLIMAAVDLVSVPVARAATNVKHIPDLYSPSQRAICTHIDVLECLNLLYVIATSCVTSTEAITRFWQSIPIDFALVLLMKAQPLPHIMLMLRILSTSSLPTTLGAIVAVGSMPDQQAKREVDMIDRLTLLLFETPEALPDPDGKALPPTPCSAKDIWDLRIRVLALLTNFSISDYGSSRLANHRNCVGRLIKHLDFSLSYLYTSPLLPTQSLTITSINISMKLIYHLMTSHPDIDIKSKLGAVQGGSHKYLVALTRLAFSEGLVLEEGIEEDVVDAAHAILDEGLSPEEGEGLLRVFSSGGSA